MEKEKHFTVLIDMKFSQEYKVMATSEKDAKRKAWIKFSSKLPKKDFTIDTNNY